MELSVEISPYIESEGQPTVDQIAFCISYHASQTGCSLINSATALLKGKHDEGKTSDGFKVLVTFTNCTGTF